MNQADSGEHHRPGTKFPSEPPRFESSPIGYLERTVPQNSVPSRQLSVYFPKPKSHSLVPASQAILKIHSRTYSTGQRGRNVAPSSRPQSTRVFLGRSHSARSTRTTKIFWFLRFFFAFVRSTTGWLYWICTLFTHGFSELWLNASSSVYESDLILSRRSFLVLRSRQLLLLSSAVGHGELMRGISIAWLCVCWWAFGCSAGIIHEEVKYRLPWSRTESEAESRVLPVLAPVLVSIFFAVCIWFVCVEMCVCVFFCDCTAYV